MTDCCRSDVWDARDWHKRDWSQDDTGLFLRAGTEQKHECLLYGDIKYVGAAKLPTLHWAQCSCGWRGPSRFKPSGAKRDRQRHLEES